MKTLDTELRIFRCIFTPESTNVAVVGYCASHQQLVVQFRSATELSIYIYRGVSELIFDAYRQSESAGAFVQKNVVNHFQFDKWKPSNDHIWIVEYGSNTATRQSICLCCRTTFSVRSHICTGSMSSVAHAAPLKAEPITTPPASPDYLALLQVQQAITATGEKRIKYLLWICTGRENGDKPKYNRVLKLIEAQGPVNEASLVKAMAALKAEVV